MISHVMVHLVKIFPIYAVMIPSYQQSHYNVNAKGLYIELSVLKSRHKLQRAVQETASNTLQLRLLICPINFDTTSKNTLVFRRHPFLCSEN